MNSQIDHNILCDAADAIVAVVKADPEKSKTTGVSVKGFTPEQVNQATAFAIRLGLLYEIPKK